MKYLFYIAGAVIFIALGIELINPLQAFIIGSITFVIVSALSGLIWLFKHN